MAHVITRPCCNDGSCVSVCPVNCIHPTPDEPEFLTAEQLYIDPETCIDCGACIDECPVEAIFPDDQLEEKDEPYLQINADYYKDHDVDGGLVPPKKTPPMPDAPLHVAIVGAGPTGVELAGTLAEIARHTLRHEFRRIDPHAARVLLLEAGPRVLSSFPESLSEKARKQLERLGVEVHTGTPVGAIDADGVLLGPQRIAARTVLWSAGVAASPLAKSLGVPLDRAGRVPVQADLSIAGLPEVFVAGDLASVQQEGKPVPGVAPAAKQMGDCVAKVIRARIAGQAAASFPRASGPWSSTPNPWITAILNR